MKLVRIKITAKTPKTSATVPLITLEKYSMAIITAALMRIILSVKPIFFFISKSIW